MNSEFKHITEIEYQHISLPILFQNRYTNRRFGLIEDKEVGFKLAWQSDLIEPDFLKLSEEQYLIGVDQNFAVVDFSSMEVLIKIPLASNYLASDIMNDKVFVSSELEVLQLSLEDFRIMNRYLLPDVFENIRTNKGELFVSCMDGSSHKLSDLQIV